MTRMPEYQDGYCIYHEAYHGNGSKIEWHHNLIFAGRQVNEVFAILPICRWVHDQARNREFRDRLDWIMLNRASDEELTYFSKASDLIRKREVLNQKYGVWQSKTTK